METEFKGGCCFCFSVKKSSDQRSKSMSGIQSSSNQQRDWGKKEEMLSDMSTFSVEEQEKRLKKAKKDEDRASKEAEKIISWVKQESARIDDSLVKTVLTDDNDHENEKAASK
ncbi:uncharacterized protein LOC114749354 [Neltuma alba]|uniref:uncharacterized protein LOC114749354 n=1 Tax=Neltuma alba TaxID=207710 RepID=UPI0010A3322D|nr:uncharacterized protein LOC114749354 [Prosopis alba]